MTSDLASRLLTLAASASSDNERWIYRAQWACVMARLGRIELARTEVVNLRSCNLSYSPTLTAWIFLAEGMIDHFDSLSVAAVDRFKRAHGLAIAIGDSEVRSTAAAWMGASEFLLAQYENACVHAVEAIQHASESSSLARSRAHLVVANCLNAVGQHVLAAKQYARARHFASEARDISMQSAILYNVAAFHISWLSVVDAFGESVEDEINVAELELNSIGNLDTGIGLDSLKAMVPLLRAQLLQMQRRWKDAEAIYAELIQEAATHGQSRIAPRYLAERAHCVAMLGLKDAALELATQALAQITARTDMDDRAACHARLSLCLAELGQHKESKDQLAEAMRCRTAFSEFQVRHRARITALAEAAQ
jgi:tetratricopeptide (TPR) repeat protein